MEPWNIVEKQARGNETRDQRRHPCLIMMLEDKWIGNSPAPPEANALTLSVTTPEPVRLKILQLTVCSKCGSDF